jgi:hypothetical protein
VGFTGELTLLNRMKSVNVRNIQGGLECLRP